MNIRLSSVSRLCCAGVAIMFLLSPPLGVRAESSGTAAVLAAPSPTPDRANVVSEAIPTPVPSILPSSQPTGNIAPTSPIASPYPTSPLPLTVPGPIPTLKPASSEIQSRILPNGLKVVVVEDHAAAVVQTSMWYRFGALDEVPGKTGLAHALEHMMFRGTPSLSDGGLDEVISRLGAEANANTSNNYTHFYFVLPANKLDLAVHLEADRMRNLLLLQRDWQLERGAVLSEYDGDLGAPTGRLYNDVCQAVTPVPMCGYGALGKREDIVRSHASDLRAYYDAYYHPNNATLVIVGDVKPETAFASAEKYFGVLPQRPLPTRSHALPKYSTGKHLIEYGDEPYTIVDMAYPFVGDLAPDEGAAAIVDGVVSNARAPFFRALIMSGIALGYETGVASNLQGGMDHVFITVAPGHTAREAEQVFRKTMSELLTTGIPDSLIQAAKRSVEVNAIYARDSIAGLGDRVGYTVGVEGRQDPREDDAEVLAATSADVNAAARTYFHDPSVVGVLIPRRPKPGAAGESGGQIADSFSGRAPSGALVEAPWVRSALASPVHVQSHVHPQKFLLPNGLRLFVQPVYENPTVFIEGNIEGSARLVPVGKEGLGDFLSSMLNYGGKKYDFAAQHGLEDSLGASLNFGSDFSAHGLAHDLPKLLEVLADGELAPRFEAQYIDLVRHQMLDEVAANDRNPDSLAERALKKLLFLPSDPGLRRPTAESVAGIRHADLVHYAQLSMRPDLTTITVVGDISPDEARREVMRYFGSWQKKGARPDVSIPHFAAPKAGSEHVPAARKLISVTLAQPAMQRSSPDFYAFNVLNAILGGDGSFDTRLMSEIRVRRGLVYGVGSSYEVTKYRGMLAIHLSATPEHVSAAVALVKEQMRDLMRRPPSQDELDRARQRLISGTLVAEEATESIAGHVMNIAQFNLPADYYQNFASRYAKISRQDIQRVAQAYLHPDRLAVVYEGPNEK